MKTNVFLLLLIAIFGLIFTGCGEGRGPGGGGSRDPVVPPIPNLSGTITITPSIDVMTGTTLYAEYNGDELVTYTWKMGSTTIIPAGTQQRFIPRQSGNYTVIVNASGFNSKTSAAVMVSGEPIAGDYEVTFDTMGGSHANSDFVPANGFAIPPFPVPTRDHPGFYVLEGWYKDPELKNIWNFGSDRVNEDITLYAKWAPNKGSGITGPGGGTIFYVSADGFKLYSDTTGSDIFYHYLEVKPFAQEIGAFIGIYGEDMEFLTEITSGEKFYGKRNTQRIIAMIEEMEDWDYTYLKTDTAAYAATRPFGGFSDWFLPSLGEVYLILDFQSEFPAVETLVDSNYYWTSTGQYVYMAVFEFPSGNLLSHPWVVNFENWVRAIRAF